MVLNAGDMARRMADRATRSGPLRVIGNPIIAALVMTALALIVFFVLLDEEACISELSWQTRFRVAIYLCTGAFFIIGLHYYALDRSFKEQYSNEETEQLVTTLGNSQKMASMGAYDSSRVPVIPGIRESDDRVEATGAYEAPGTTLRIVPAEVNLLPQAVPHT